MRIRDFYPIETAFPYTVKHVDQLLFKAYAQEKLNMNPESGLVPNSAPKTEFPKNLYSPLCGEMNH